MASTKKSTRSFVTHVPISIPDEGEESGYKHYEAGAKVDDIPSEDATNLINNGAISPVGDDGEAEESDIAHAAVATPENSGTIIATVFPYDPSTEEADYTTPMTPSAAEQGYEGNVVDRGGSSSLGKGAIPTMGQEG